MEYITYLIAQIFECESTQLSHWHSCDTKVKPGAIVFSFHVWRSITGDPDIEIVFLVATRGLGHIPTAKLAAEHDVRIGNLPTSPLRVRFNHLLAVNWLKWGQLLLWLLLRAASVSWVVRNSAGSASITLAFWLTALFESMTIFTLVVRGSQSSSSLTAL